MNRIDELAHHVAEILRLIGLDAAADAELRRTPERVAQLYVELFRGVNQAPPDISVMANSQSSEEMIVVRDLPFHSICVHHLVPFFGHGHIGYVPGETIAGFGGLGRILSHYASQPQLQERLTTAVADHLETTLRPRGVVVWLQARQLCLEMRGERLPGLVETTAARGLLRAGPLRQEFFAGVKGGSRRGA